MMLVDYVTTVSAIHRIHWYKDWSEHAVEAFYRTGQKLGQPGPVLLKTPRLHARSRLYEFGLKSFYSVTRFLENLPSEFLAVDRFPVIRFSNTHKQPHYSMLLKIASYYYCYCYYSKTKGIRKRVRSFVEPGRKKGRAGKWASWLLRDVWCAEYWVESARGQEPLKNGGSKQNFAAYTKFTVTDERFFFAVWQWSSVYNLQALSGE